MKLEPHETMLSKDISWRKILIAWNKWYFSLVSQYSFLHCFEKHQQVPGVRDTPSVVFEQYTEKWTPNVIWIFGHTKEVNSDTKKSEYSQQAAPPFNSLLYRSG